MRPWIDVSDVLTDPMIAGESFTVTRRREIVNDFGEVGTENTSLPALGSIVPVGSNSLLREDALQTQSKTIRVISTFRLRGVAETVDGSKWQPDIVFWNGDHYLVKTVDDYSSYGAGLVEAECSSIDFEDKPPAPAISARPTSAAVFSIPADSGLISVI